MVHVGGDGIAPRQLGGEGRQESACWLSKSRARRKSGQKYGERPKGEKEPVKYWFSTVPEVSFHRRVDYAKLCWRNEHNYVELKQEVWLRDFQGQGGVPDLRRRLIAKLAPTSHATRAAQRKYSSRRVHIVI